RNADNQRDTLDLTQTLLDGGRGTRLDVARARSQFESTLASIPPLETVIRAEIYRLGVLLGRSPDALLGELASAAELPVIPERMTVALPSELIARRPDIQEAEFALIAATERIGVATAELYPRFDLFASLGRTSLSLSGLDNSSAETYRYGVSALWPIFDLSRVRARIAVADADALAALANFEERFLQAQAEVETALVRFMNERRRRGHLRTSADETGRAVALARERFESGVDNFLQVLDAERRLLEIEDQLAISNTDVVRSLINLYKAMGGGWIQRAQVVSADEAESPTPENAVRSM
ncbi:MAG: TolC family protein, partial [Wenzhouxiangellaceae bacterium]